MYFEKLGFMLAFWNLAGVPLSYCHCTIYLANHHPSEYAHPKWVLALLFVAYLFFYWIWDTTNSQKNHFRHTEGGNGKVRKTFPQLPWQYVKNPKTIQTKTGKNLLCDGWYGLARKIHYTCDLWFALNWGFITGFRSPFPWFYPVFFTIMIIHRATRDIQRCRKQYGEAWAEYERQVPYLFIPVRSLSLQRDALVADRISRSTSSERLGDNLQAFGLVDRRFRAQNPHEFGFPRGRGERHASMHLIRLLLHERQKFGGFMRRVHRWVAVFI